MQKIIWERFSHGTSKNTSVDLRFDLKQFFVGVRVERYFRMGYEINPDQKIKRTKRGTAYQDESITLTICFIPCLPIKIKRVWL